MMNPKANFLYSFFGRRKKKSKMRPLGLSLVQDAQVALGGDVGDTDGMSECVGLRDASQQQRVSAAYHCCVRLPYVNAA
jgi:hypothetical protein